MLHPINPYKTVKTATKFCGKDEVKPINFYTMMSAVAYIRSGDGYDRKIQYFYNILDIINRKQW